MKVHMYDFRWIDRDTVEFQADVNGRFGKKPLRIGDTLAVEVCSDISCAGSCSEGIWKPCPEKTTGKAKCDLCKARERKDSFVFTVFDGFDEQHLSPSDLDKISGPHVVYLALFDTNIIKVGVAKKTRKVLRQIEQGAHFTAFIAETPDGIKARQIETLIRNNGLQDKVKVSRKKDLLMPEISDSEGKALLEEIFVQHKSIFSEYPVLKDFLLEKSEFVDWDSVYHLCEVMQSPKSLHSVELSQGESVSGIIRAIKGPFLILEIPDEFIVLCAKDLTGMEIDFSEKPPGLNLSTAFQGALF